jgi:hypothetical protein
MKGPKRIERQQHKTDHANNLGPEPEIAMDILHSLE